MLSGVIDQFLRGGVEGITGAKQTGSIGDIFKGLLKGFLGGAFKAVLGGVLGGLL